jgi:hypothetical protein
MPIDQERIKNLSLIPVFQNREACAAVDTREIIMSRFYVYVVLLPFFLVLGAVNGSAQFRDYKFEKWTFSTNVLTLEKFLPWSTILFIERRKSIDIPTIYSLEAPKDRRVKVNPDFERIKTEWSAKYPRSSVIEIHHYPLFESQGLNHGREAYVWIIADGNILNIELVRKGACTAQAMLLDSVNEPYISIPKGLYDEIKKRIVDAEKMAQADGIGIWKKS